MVEVFKTNVTTYDHANLVIREIRKAFRHYEANFDLEDCDNILRVRCIKGFVQADSLISLLRKYGFEAEVLEEQEPLLKVV